MSNAAIPDKLAEDSYLYGYSIDEAYKFFYETAVETKTPYTVSKTFVISQTIPILRTPPSITIPCI